MRHLLGPGGLHDAEGAAVLGVDVGLRSDGRILLGLEEDEEAGAGRGLQGAPPGVHDLVLQLPHLPRPVVDAVHLLACSQDSRNWRHVE